MDFQRPFGAASNALDRFIDALTDLKQRDHAVLAALLDYLLVWTLYGIIAKSNQDLHPDMTELVAWSRDLALGFSKHPPFAAIVVRGWFALLPIANWSFYLLAMLTATCALWIAWLQFTDYLDAKKSLVGLCLLTFIPFFNFHALKYNVNTVLIPLWAVTTFWFLRSYRTQNATYAALAGISAALCMVSKYWSIFLLAGLALAAVSDFRRASYFRSAAPWITILTGITILSPHIGWLQKHEFSPFEYAMAVHGGHSMTEALWADLRYLADAAAYVVMPVALVLLLARPDLQTIADIAWPADADRRLIAVAFWATLVLPVVPALLLGIEIHGIWSMSSWTLLPIVLLSSPSIELPQASIRWIAGLAVASPPLLLIAAPAVAVVHQLQGMPPEITQTRMLAARVENAWRNTTPKPLHYVGGNLAEGVLTYVRSRPELLPDFPQWHSKRVAEAGIALVCYSDDASCIASSREIANENPQSRSVDTRLSRSFLGIAGQPQNYVIFIVPPI